MSYTRYVEKVKRKVVLVGKKTIAIVIVLILIILGGAAYYVWRSKNAEDTPPKGVTVGRLVLLSDWGVTFQLPSSIPVTELRTTKDSDSTSDIMIISDSRVAALYDYDTCPGLNFQLGELFAVYRFTEPNESTKKIGNSYYSVIKPAVASTCYSDDIMKKYFDDKVQATAEATLRAND